MITISVIQSRQLRTLVPAGGNSKSSETIVLPAARTERIKLTRGLELVRTVFWIVHLAIPGLHAKADTRKITLKDGSINPGKQGLVSEMEQLHAA